LGLAPSQLISPHTNRRFNSGGNNAYDACGIGECCSSAAVLCSKRFRNMDNRRSNCVSSTHSPDTHNHNSDTRSYNDTPDNRNRSQLHQRQLKLERQLVSLESKPARLLPMELKEVFSCILLC